MNNSNDGNDSDSVCVFLFQQSAKEANLTVQSRLKCAAGLADLATRKYKSAAKHFLLANFDHCDFPEVSVFLFELFNIIFHRNHSSSIIHFSATFHHTYSFRTCQKSVWCAFVVLNHDPLEIAGSTFFTHLRCRILSFVRTFWMVIILLNSSKRLVISLLFFLSMFAAPLSFQCCNLWCFVCSGVL